MSTPTPADADQVIRRLIRRAEEAWVNQHYQKGIELIEQASRQDPKNPSLVFQLARAHGLRYDYKTAERFLERAIQLSPNRAEGLSEAGQTALEFEQLDMAVTYLRRAGRERDVTIGALMTLADICVRDRLIDEAADLVGRASWTNREDPRVPLIDARVRRARGDAPGAESLLRTTLARSDAGAAVRIRGLYELADIFDRSGRFDEAMTTLLEVKAIQRPLAAPYLPTTNLIQQRAKEMERTITTGVLDRWRSQAPQLDPQRRIALLCGHPRSGTTLLEQVLDAHPDVISAEETKIMHDEAYLPLVRDFPEGTSILDALDSSPPSVLRHARENYVQSVERFLGEQVGSRLLIDKNPALNMLIPMVVRVFPEARFLVAIRDPRDVVLSCFMQALPMTPISAAYLSIESTVRQYASAVGFWLEMRPRMADRWIEVRYEQMVDDLPRVARETLAFLGLSFDPKVLAFHEHAAGKRVNSPSHADVRKPLYRSALGRWRNYEKYLEPYFGGLEPFMTALGYS